MSRSKLFGISLLAIVAICPQFPMVAQPPGGGGVGGPCTNYGCVPFVSIMAPIRWAGGGTTAAYCLRFNGKMNARKVRNLGEGQGGYPKRIAGRITTEISLTGCPACVAPLGNQNVIAVKGGNWPGGQSFQGTFGRYVCRMPAPAP